MNLPQAVKMAIDALEKERHQFSFGYHAYRNGIKPDVINDEDVTGVMFGTFQRDHQKYVKLDQAVQEMEDLLDILGDEPVEVIKQGNFFE